MNKVLQSRVYYGLLTVLPALVGACGPVRTAVSPELLGAHANAKTLVFAYELTSTCQLEAISGDASPVAGAGWSKLATNDLAGVEVAVLDKQTSSDRGHSLTRALRVKEPNGRVRWLRNVPAGSAGEVEQRWACAPDAERVMRSTKAIDAEVVRIVPSAPSCAALMPLLGQTADVTFEPYKIAGRRLFYTTAGLALAVTLVAGDGENVLTVLGSDLDACFAVTHRPPTPPADRAALMAWLGEPNTAPPPADLASYRQTVGLEDNACLSEGEGTTKHDECRGAVFGIAKQAGGPLGTRFVFFRERVATAVHAYGGKLAPAEDLAQVNVVVRQVQSREDGSFGATFSKTLLTSLLDGPSQRTRNARGYRIIRPQEAAGGTTVNAYLEIDASFSMPRLETQQQDGRQRRVRGKIQVPNPDHARADLRVEAAREALHAAEGEADAYGKLFSAPRPRCGAQAPAACDVAAAPGIGGARVAKRRASIATLESAASRTPQTVTEDDIVTVDYRGKVYRRQGEVTVTFKLTPTDALPGTPVVQVTRRTAFDATEVEGAASLGAEAKSARPPEREQVDQAVANAILAETDALLTTWMQRATPAAPAAAFEPGSRAQLALLARFTASNRRVKLFSDLIEDRPDRLARRAEYPINVPAGANRCYTFVATPLQHGGNANLVLRTRPSAALVARDARDARDAGFEVCPMAPGEYTLEMTSASPTAIGMFESTPGVAPDPDYGATMPASLGTPKPRTSPGGAPAPAPAPKR